MGPCNSLDNSYTICYTIFMKTAISIDKNLFDDAEKYSRAIGLSRSKLYCDAIKEFIGNHSPDIVTEKLNCYYDKHESGLDDDIKEVTYRLLDKEDW